MLSSASSAGDPAQMSVPEVMSARLRGEQVSGAKLALCIEGGSMRGCISGGMAAAIGQTLGLMSCFDRVYATSVGAVSAAYLLAGQPEQILGLGETMAKHPGFIKPSRVWKIMDLDVLFESGLGSAHKMDYRAVSENPISFHPLASSLKYKGALSVVEYLADIGVELGARDRLNNPTEIKWAIRQATTLPLVSGLIPDNGLDGLWDAGFHEPFPAVTPHRHGFTHLLVLRTQKESARNPAFSNAVLRIGRHLGAISYRDYCQRVERMDDIIVAHIHCPSAQISHLEKDPSKARSATRAGYNAAQQWLQENISSK